MKPASLSCLCALCSTALLLSSCDFSPLPNDEMAIKLGEVKAKEDKKENLPEATVDAEGNLILPPSLEGSPLPEGTPADPATATIEKGNVNESATLLATYPVVESQIGVAESDNTFLYSVLGQELKAKVSFKKTKIATGEQQDIASVIVTQGKNTFNVPTAALFAPQTQNPELNALYQNLPATVFVRFQGKADSPVLKVTLFCGEGEQACDVSFIFAQGKLISRTLLQNGKESTVTYP